MKTLQTPGGSGGVSGLQGKGFVLVVVVVFKFPPVVGRVSWDKGQRVVPVEALVIPSPPPGSKSGSVEGNEIRMGVGDAEGRVQCSQGVCSLAPNLMS